MAALEVKIVNNSPHALPAYATEGASGMDLRASLAQEVILKPLERALISTGLFMEIPEGYEAQVRPRSGMAIKYGLSCLNTPGTIDSDYRGEIKVIMVNLSNETQTIQDGDRIAQMVFQKIEKVHWIPVKELSVSVRNEGGFGHTGKI